VPNQDDPLDGISTREQSAQLVVSIERDRNGRERLVVRDDRGLKIRGITNIEIDQDHAGLASAAIRVLIDSKRGLALKGI
jgi:DNA transposition AAA+ family ATPase